MGDDGRWHLRQHLCEIRACCEAAIRDLDRAELLAGVRLRSGPHEAAVKVRRWRTDEFGREIADKVWQLRIDLVNKCVVPADLRAVRDGVVP